MTSEFRPLLGSCSLTSQEMILILVQSLSLGQQTAVVLPARGMHDCEALQQKSSGRVLGQDEAQVS